MRYLFLFMTFLLWQNVQLAQNPKATTYSIVAIDRETGDMGVAVQSHWFAVGTVVPWGEAGVGVVATQSMANPEYGPKGLRLMNNGMSPGEAIQALIEADPGQAYRQVALLNAEGETAVHTGDSCIGAAGHMTGDGYSVQANLMTDASVWKAMADRFEQTEGQPLAERLLSSLEAAEQVGGDIRGKQSAALLVVRAESTGSEYADCLVDLRVDDHENPLEELRRLYTIDQAYDWLSKGDQAIEKENFNAAESAYSMAAQLYPTNMELRAWASVGWLNAKKEQQAADLFRIVLKEEPGWKDILMRLHEVGLVDRSKEELKNWLTQFD